MQGLGGCFQKPLPKAAGALGTRAWDFALHKALSVPKPTLHHCPWNKVSLETLPRS